MRMRWEEGDESKETPGSPADGGERPYRRPHVGIGQSQPPRRGWEPSRIALLALLFALVITVAAAWIWQMTDLQPAKPPVTIEQQQKPSAQPAPKPANGAKVEAPVAPKEPALPSLAERRAAREKAAQEAERAASKDAVKGGEVKKENGGSFFVFDALGWVVGTLLNIVVGALALTVLAIVVVALGKPTIPQAIGKVFGWWKTAVLWIIGIVPFVWHWFRTKVLGKRDDDDWSSSSFGGGDILS